MAKYLSKAIAERKKHSVEPIEKKKYNCRKQPVNEMLLVFARKLTSVLGTVELTYQISRNAKFPRRMYIGVWRCWSQHTAQMMAPLPMRVKR